MKTMLAAITILISSACGSNSHPPGSQGPGLSCGSTADCQTGLTCATEDPGGQCIKTCAPRQDLTCHDLNLVCSFEGHCYFRCQTTADCVRANEGYVCQDDKPPRGIKYCDKAATP